MRGSCNRREDIDTQSLIDDFKKTKRIQDTANNFDCSNTLVLYRFEKAGFDYEKYTDRKKRRGIAGTSDQEEIERRKAILRKYRPELLEFILDLIEGKYKEVSR